MVSWLSRRLFLNEVVYVLRCLSASSLITFCFSRFAI
ncbi:hypothetical protein TSMEX_001435 [Taenia solium]|eukprot:TsM_000162900 transcript=TsM_000162900 gene=TsM_000162900